MEKVVFVNSNMKTKICKGCGDEYTPKRKQQQFHSHACATAYNKKYGNICIPRDYITRTRKYSEDPCLEVGY